MWSLEKIQCGFLAAVNDDDVSLLSVLLQIAQIRKINMNTLFPNTPEAEYKVNGNDFKLNLLHLAVHKKKHSALKYMLESNLFDVNFKTCSLSLLKQSDRTPLHFAMINSDAIAIKLLLDTPGIKLKIYDIKNFTPLNQLLNKKIHNTKSIECIESFRNAISENEFLNMCDGITLILACNARFNELTKYLIPRIKDVNHQKERYGMTPLFCAVLRRLETSVVQAFLDHPGIDVNMRTLYQSLVITPLHLAVKINNMRAFTLLVNHTKTNVNKIEDYIKNYTSRIDGTPLFSAVRLNNVEAVRLLLEHKADLLSRSYQKICICDCSAPKHGNYIDTFQMAQHNENSEILKLLHEAKEKQ